ncbi:hypothetical protein GCM10009540_70720 [Streptomyces turgidiscabies]|nr:acyl-CoA dehydrogenase family protein [Streptomyces turgidiscabies]GAQ75374.1 hypothetical protein T45_07155 [Streptomyces turgidiscabies]
MKHRLADACKLVEPACSAALRAAFAVAEGSTGLTRSCAVAESVCSEAFTAVAGEMIQFHGGIGITWEHAAHRYFKRAHSSAQFFERPAWHRARIARDLGLHTAPAVARTSGSPQQRP